MKKILALALALTLLFAMAAPALAAEPYGAVVTLGGETVDTTGIPAAPDGYIPLRALCEANGGYVEWYPEDNESFFQLGDYSVIVKYADLSVVVDFELVEGIQAYLDPRGYTYIPVEMLVDLTKIGVETTMEEGVTTYAVELLGANLSEMAKLAYDIVDATEMGSVMDLSAEAEYLEAMGIRAENYTELVFLYPMMSANPSMVLIGEVAEGAMDAAKEDFEAVRDSLMTNMGNYPSSAEAIEAGQIVEAPDGNHLMFVVSFEANEMASEMFQAAYTSRER